MKIDKTFEINHPRSFVWSKFSDVGFVADCLPGASVVATLGDNRYKGRMSVKVGPMAAAFDGDITIETQPQAWAGSVSGKGADARSSSRASGTLRYSLTSIGADRTRVDIVADFNLAGPLAQFSKGPIVQEIANRITATFVENFETRLGTTAAPAAAAAQPAERPAAPSLDAGNLLWTILRDRVRGLLRKIFDRSSAAS
jgi:carbon monoxide dehydrogenase subunit G